LVPLASRAAVDQAVANQRAIAAVFEAARITRRGIFIFSTEPGADGATAYSRMMARTRIPPLDRRAGRWAVTA
jgi:hypothetical protein